MRARKGFTLIELVLSIAIILVITAAMSVSVNSYMQRTQSAALIVSEHDNDDSDDDHCDNNNGCNDDNDSDNNRIDIGDDDADDNNTDDNCRYAAPRSDHTVSRHNIEGGRDYLETRI